ncbi:MAG: M4 family peptidase, partial [Mycobacterium sp.]
MWGCHGRFIVPAAVLRRLADDDSIPAQARQALLDSAAMESVWRELRHAHSEATQSTLLTRGIASLRLAGVLARVPAVTVYDCKNTQSLPGT